MAERSRPVRTWVLLCGCLAFAVAALAPSFAGAPTVASASPSVVASLPAVTTPPSTPKPRALDLALLAGAAFFLLGVGVSTARRREPACPATRRVRYASLRAPPFPTLAV